MNGMTRKEYEERLREILQKLGFPPDQGGLDFSSPQPGDVPGDGMFSAAGTIDSSLEYEDYGVTVNLYDPNDNGNTPIPLFPAMPMGPWLTDQFLFQFNGVDTGVYLLLRGAVADNTGAEIASKSELIRCVP